MLEETTELERQFKPFFDRIRLRDTLGPEEERAIKAAARERLQFAPGEDLVREGDRPMRSILLTRGITCRYRIVSGGARQLVAIHLPGDFVDLHSFLLKQMDHSVGALTACDVITFPHENLVRVTERLPHLTRMLWLMTLIDGSAHREWLVGMGLLSATQRAAHLFCEIYRRLEVVGLARDNRFSFPVTQAALADAVGTSSVHVNRVIQELRQRDLITWEGGVITIRDWDALSHLADFDDGYLHLTQECR
ncbi:Crp/Fnr family transcriptional regulator [Devosia sp. FJ2-5-3]|uniref:Crp/Fnr family transcriptional regulator n=1 Tax=Devosia sp. FJ2-5-3 TaxID=2976680 RepID=UPI0023D830C7|nr:Crp/Fnr family transcriptional regulator [Devosia sp. FJ2-5-3]WEJ59249.1 Crp/Fnr family transcriptional regulator [Devosia sp. FJ2-5-3]